MKLSIIIPALNEADNISQTLDSLQNLRKTGHEIIIVDGGSKDATCFIAKSKVDRLITCEPGRARQMNTGARLATGAILIFLHSDTTLPANIEDIFMKIGKKSYWGRFDIRLSGESTIFRLIEWMINTRSRFTGVATGDQAIFMTRELFQTVGGYPNIPLMEDIALSKRLKRISSPVCIPRYVVTSSRRWEENGILKTILLMWMLRLKYAFGISPDELAKQYE